MFYFTILIFIYIQGQKDKKKEQNCQPLEEKNNTGKKTQ